MSEQDGAGGQQDNKSAGDSIQIKVGGEVKTFSPQELATRLEKAGNLERTVEQLSGFQKILTQYGIGADEYLKNSEAAFAIANTLIEKGVIDEQGNIVEKRTQDPRSSDDGKPTFRFSDDASKDKQLETIGKALQAIVNKVEKLEEGQSNIYRRNIKRDVQAMHPELDDADISKLLALSQRDKSRGFWDHAANLANEKSTRTKQTEKSFVKSVVETLGKIGALKEGAIDMSKLDELDLNSLKESDPSGGSPTYEGKKFIFGARKRRLGLKGTDADKFASPADATHEMFKRIGG